MRFIPLFIQALEFKYYYSIMPGKPKTGGSDRMTPPGRNVLLDIKRLPSGSSENRTFPGSDPFVIYLRH
jgi:hypothetical protein